MKMAVQHNLFTLSTIVFLISILSSVCKGVKGAKTVFVGDVCQDYLQNLGKNHTSFELCALLNARPFTMCLRCNEDYAGAFAMFDNLAKARGDVAKQCQKTLLSGDRVSIIDKDFEHLKDLWGTAHCDNCFVRTMDGNGYITFNVSADTSDFLAKSVKLDECIDVQKVSKTVCKGCSPYFTDISLFYNTLVEKNEGIVCMDITDRMNRTRQEWSTYGCTHVFRAGSDVFITAGVVAAITILFYFIARISQNPRDTEIIKVRTLRRIMLHRERSTQDTKRLFLDSDSGELMPSTSTISPIRK